MKERLHTEHIVDHRASFPKQFATLQGQEAPSRVLAPSLTRSTAGFGLNPARKLSLTRK
jgi:hypothetical protein